MRTKETIQFSTVYNQRPDAHILALHGFLSLSLISCLICAVKTLKTLCANDPNDLASHFTLTDTTPMPGTVLSNMFDVLQFQTSQNSLKFSICYEDPMNFYFDADELDMEYNLCVFCILCWIGVFVVVHFWTECSFQLCDQADSISLVGSRLPMFTNL